VIRPDALTRFAIPRSNITEIQRWNPGHRDLFDSAILGALGGALVGGFLGYQSGCDHCDGDMRPLSAMVGVVFGGGFGLLTGLFVGYSHRSFWETVQ
jgi:hypothetical protein